MGLTGDDGVLRRCPSVPRSRSSSAKIPDVDERDGQRTTTARSAFNFERGDEMIRRRGTTTAERRNGKPTNGEDVDGEHGAK